MYAKRSIEARSHNHCCRGKAISITYSECVCVHACARSPLFIQHAKRVRCIVLSFMASRALPYFSTLARKRHDFRKRSFERKTCCVSTILSGTFLILRRIQRRIIINARRSSCDVPVILIIFQCHFNFLYRFSKNTQIWSFMKILPVDADFFMRTDGRTDRPNGAYSRFLQLCDRAKISSLSDKLKTP
jgi:hypothetical protein